MSTTRFCISLSHLTASPAINPVDRTIYITTLDSTLVALNPINGHTNWVATVPNSTTADLVSSPAVNSNGTAVYVGSDNGNLFAFHTNGSLWWSTNLGGEIFSSPAVNATGDTVYVCASDSSRGTLFSLNATNGATNWSFAINDDFSSSSSSDSSPAIGADGTIYFLAGTGRLYAIRPDGLLSWFFPMAADSAPAGSPAIDAQGNIVIGSSDGYLYCVSPFGGLRWLCNLGNNLYAVSASPAIGEDGTVYATTTDGRTFAVSNGIVQWSFTNTASGTFLSSPAVSSSRVVFAGAPDSSMGLYAMAGGVLRTNHPTAGGIYSSPAIDPKDGGVIIADMAGYVYKFPGIGALSPDAPWPMFHGPASRAGAVAPAALLTSSATPFPYNLGLSSGTFATQLIGPPGTYWGIYAATNLTDWSLVGQVALDSRGTASFADSNATNVSRFYQARSAGACSRIFGFIQETVAPYSTSLLANPFYLVKDLEWPQNSLAEWTTQMNRASMTPPDGAQITNWNGAGFDTYTFFAAGDTWTPNNDLTLLPGKSFYFVNPSGASYTLSFSGLVTPGTPTNPISTNLNFVSSLTPKAGYIHTDLGYSPANGDKVLLWSINHFTTNTYTTNWSSGEPFLGLGQGAALAVSQTNNWVGNSPPDCPDLIVVTAKPVWTDTGKSVGISNVIHFPAHGNWTPGGDVLTDADGVGTDDVADGFVHAPSFSLIAFVGPSPYLDTNGVNQWTSNNTYFPQPAGGTNGYWFVGSGGTFTNNRAGELWFGINDDALTLITNDNAGALFGELTITTNTP